jgi:hypothetical protein
VYLDRGVWYVSKASIMGDVMDSNTAQMILDGGVINNLDRGNLYPDLVGHP